MKRLKKDTASSPFWESPTLDEVAARQGVQPQTNVLALFGTWPGEEDDGFEEMIDELRHPERKRDRGERRKRSDDAR